MRCFLFLFTVSWSSPRASQTVSVRSPLCALTLRFSERLVVVAGTTVVQICWGSRILKVPCLSSQVLRSPLPKQLLSINYSQATTSIAYNYTYPYAICKKFELDSIAHRHSISIPFAFTSEQYFCIFSVYIYICVCITNYITHTHTHYIYILYICEFIHPSMTEIILDHSLSMAPGLGHGSDPQRAGASADCHQDPLWSVAQGSLETLWAWNGIEFDIFSFF